MGWWHVLISFVIGLVIWRADVVKLLPQTADFFKLVGLEVNLRGLAIKDVKIASETVDGKPVVRYSRLRFTPARAATGQGAPASRAPAGK